MDDMPGYAMFSCVVQERFVRIFGDTLDISDSACRLIY
jgi:hypothetical protein